MKYFGSKSLYDNYSGEIFVNGYQIDRVSRLRL